MGYIWVLPEESDTLVESGVPIVQINDGPNFIHSFSTAEDGNINVEARYPVCKYAEAPCRRCGIYKKRPMVCRLWPIGLETHDGKVVLGLHLDCLFVRYLQEHGLVPGFKRRALNLMTRLSPDLKEAIASTYFAVDAIAKFPNGENRYLILQEF
jgi:Fe-S-cluster containining protein